MSERCLRSIFKPVVVQAQQSVTENLRPFRPVAFRELDDIGPRYMAFYSGRASAKSHSVAQTVVRWGEKRPIRGLFLRETLKSLKDSSRQLLVDWIDVLGMNDRYDIIRDEIRGPQGTTFRFGGLAKNSAGQVRSAAGVNLVVVEEAHEISEESLRILRPTIRDPGALLIFLWNPQFAIDAVDNFFRGAEAPPASIIRKVSWRDNPFLDAAMHTEMEYDRRRDPAMYEHVWEGGYLQITDAQIFAGCWRYEDMDEEVAEMKPIPRIGCDFGFAKDPIALIEAYALPGDRIYVKREQHQVKLPVLKTAEWLKRFDQVTARHLVVCDNARPEIIAAVKEDGVNAKPAFKGPESVIEGVEYLRSREIILHPNCKRLGQELTHYSFKLDPHTDEPLPEIKRRQADHCIDALRYAFEPLRRARKRRVIATAAPRVFH